MSYLVKLGLSHELWDSIVVIEFVITELAQGPSLFGKKSRRTVELSKRSYRSCSKDRSTVARSVKKPGVQGFGSAEGSQGQQEEQGMVCDGKRRNLSFILAENNYSEETSLQGFSQAEVKALEKMLAMRVRENITGTGKQSKGQKETIIKKRCIMKVMA